MDGDDKLMLNDKQWMELYTASIENRKDILWIREEIDSNNIEIGDCQKRINAMEIDHGFNKGKMASLVMLTTALVTIMVNGILWAFNALGGGN